MAHALENVSGVITQVQYGVYEWYTVSGITQQSGNDFVYVDGMTLTGNRPSTQLNNVEEVQVFKGPAAILFGGAGAGQGGVVNIVRKKPSAIRSREVQYRVGRWGLQQVSGSSTGSVFNMERLLYRMDASFAHTDGWRQTGSNRFTVAPEMTWLIAPKMRVTAIQTITRDRFTLDAGVPAALLARPGGFPFDRKLNPAGDFDLSRDWQNEIDYVYNVTNRLTINNTFFKRRNRDQYSDAETLTYVPATDQVTRGILYFQHNRRPIQDITDLVGDYRFLHMRHHFLARYDYSDQYNFTNRTGNAPNTSNSINLPLPVSVPAFIAGTFVDTAPVYTTFPITRVDYSDNLFHRVTLQDQINPVKWLGVNVSVTRPNYDREDAQRRLRQRDVRKPWRRNAFREQFDQQLPVRRSGHLTICALAPWSRAILQLQQYFHTGKLGAKRRNAARSRSQHELGSGESVARTKQPVEHQGGRSQDPGPE